MAVLDCKWLSGFLLALGGDLISGSIHEELRITNELTAHEQVRFVVEEISAGIRSLADKFERVHVASVPGNHGRNTLKDSAEQYSKLNYDTTGCGYDRSPVWWMIPENILPDRMLGRSGHPGLWIALYHLIAWAIRSGTGGGQGFTGPDLPIVRGGKESRRPATVLRGPQNRSACYAGHLHYLHYTPGRFLSNGLGGPGVSGYTRLISVFRDRASRSSGSLCSMRSWCISGRGMDVQLENPAPPPKPVIRVPSWSAPQ